MPLHSDIPEFLQFTVDVGFFEDNNEIVLDDSD
jgi:hypothetical protein